MADNEVSYVVQLTGVSAAEADQYASELRSFLLDSIPSITAERHRDNKLTQDFGASLAIVLGAPSAVAFVKSLGKYLQLRQSARITIRTSKGSLVGENLTSDAVVQLAEKFTTSEGEH